MTDGALSVVASAGLWPAVPVTGWWILRRTGSLSAITTWPWITRVSFVCAVGISLWSLPMMLLGLMGHYSPVAMGLAGWAIAGLLSTILLSELRDRLGIALSWHSIMSEAVPAIAIIALSLLYVLFPIESIRGGGDAGTYANCGVRLAGEGGQAIRHPHIICGTTLPPGLLRELPGFYAKERTMVPQFSSLLPAWLAQAYGTAGFNGLYRLNPLLALLALGAVFGMARELSGQALGLWATIIVGLSMPNLFCARNTLSEILAQLFVWSGMLALWEGLRRPDRHIALWGGIFFGFDALVRIDMLILAPLLVLAHIGSRIAQPEDRLTGRTWISAHIAALSIWAISIGYYVFFSPLYFRGLRSQVLDIACLLLISLMVMVSVRERVLVILRPIVTSKVSLWAAAIGIAASAAYAYWIRPRLPTPAIFSTTMWNTVGWLLGRRDYREESLIILAGYLSAVLIFVSIAGFVVYMFQVARTAGGGTMLALTALAFTVLYLYNPAITPVQVYAERRFVVITIPAIALFAALGLFHLTRSSAKRWGMAVTTLVVAYTSAFVAYASWPALFLSENYGYTARLAAIAAEIPPDIPVVVYGAGDATEWMTPLSLAFRRRLIPVNTATIGQQMQLRNLMESLAKKGQAALFLTDERWVSAANVLEDVGICELKRRFLEETYAPPSPPRRIVSDTANLFLYHVRPAKGEDQFGKIRPGAQHVLEVGEDGFFLDQTTSGSPSRWTTGEGVLEFHFAKGRRPQHLEVRISNSGPSGTSLAILANGEEIFNGHIGPGPWSTNLDLGRLTNIRENLEVVLRSGTFVPADVYPGSTDHRKLGVLVQWVRPLFGPETKGVLQPELPIYRSSIQLEEPSARIHVRVGGKLPVVFLVKNLGMLTWLPFGESQGGDVRLGMRWFSAGHARLMGEARADFSGSIHTGGVARIPAVLWPVDSEGKPLGPGQYILDVSMVREGACWFEEQGDKTMSLPVEVTR